MDNKSLSKSPLFNGSYFKNLGRFFSLKLVILYVFLAPLGNLTRFGSNEGSFGITTFILTLTVLINLFSSIVLTIKHQLFFILILLCFWMFFSSIFAFNISEAYVNLFGFLMYILFAAAAYNIGWNVKKLHLLILFFILGGFVSSLATLIDFFNLFDIPGVNEVTGGKKTSMGDIMQASGPFARRSAMAAYFSLLIPIATLSSFYLKNVSWAFRIGSLISAALCIFALMITGNRAGNLGAIIAIIIISFLTSRSPIKILKLIFIGLILTIIIGFLIVTYFPDQLIVYEALFGFGGVELIKLDEQAESDIVRILLFEHAITALLKNPFGHGYSNLYGFFGNDNADPHNNITQIIWGAGFFGIGCLLFFTTKMYFKLNFFFRGRRFNNYASYGIVIFGALLGWLVCGMTHTVIGTGVAWIFFGVLLKTIMFMPDE